MADHQHSNKRPDSVPPFACRLPREFLDGLDERGRFLYQEADRNSQMMEWLMQHSIAHGQKLDEVKVQVERTNGRLLTAEKDIRNLNEAVDIQRTQLEPVAKAYGYASKAAQSKWAWGAFAFFVLVALPLIVKNAPAPSAFFKAAAGLFGLS
jgi:hypothetical protein